MKVGYAPGNATPPSPTPSFFSLVQDKSGYKVLVAFIYSSRHHQQEPKWQQKPWQQKEK